MPLSHEPLIHKMWKTTGAFLGGESKFVCLCICRDTAAGVTMALAVLHLGSPHADGQSAEETESGPLRSSGR